MRTHYLQHVPFEGLGSIEAWLQSAGYEITRTRFFVDEKLPEVEDVDLLVIMGGPMSANDEADYPWLIQEKKFIKSAIEAGKSTLGVCLGAQLIASVMGERVFSNAVKEIGWFPVQAKNTEQQDVFRFPEEVEVFHWHGETFNLPQGAIQIAESKGCKNQAFQVGSTVIALQFHLETTPDSAWQIVMNCRDELTQGEYIQTESEILAASKERYSLINDLMKHILEYLHRNRADLKGSLKNTFTF